MWKCVAIVFRVCWQAKLSCDHVTAENVKGVQRHQSANVKDIYQQRWVTNGLKFVDNQLKLELFL